MQDDAKGQKTGAGALHLWGSGFRARAARLPAMIAAALGIAALGILAVPGAADVRRDTPAVHYYTPKRVQPPAPGTQRFLTIQINPVEQARELALAAARPFSPVARSGAGGGAIPGAAPSASYAWFWERVSPAMSGQRGGRLGEAIVALGAGPDGRAVRGPRLQHMQAIAERHGNEILAATVGTEVSPALVLAVISTESAGRANAVSHAGAVGLMQLIPATAARFSVPDSFNPAMNIRGGVAYLDWLMKQFDRDPLMVLAAYNAGENAVRRNGGVPPYAETRDYVPKVLAAWMVARGLCLTPPEMVSDGCVFAFKG